MKETTYKLRARDYALAALLLCCEIAVGILAVVL